MVQCSYIGTDPSGTSAVGNSASGILIHSPNNTVGGTTPDLRNLISGNLDEGVRIEDNFIGQITNLATNNDIIGNYIGTDITGAVAIPNLFHGVNINGPLGNRVGGPAPGAGNVISGNARIGVLVGLGQSLVQGNLIGTNASGTAALGNGGVGVFVNGASNTVIAGNLVSANTQGGVRVNGQAASSNVLRDNRIGTDVAGTVDLGNGSFGVAVTGGATNTSVGGSGDGDGNLISGNADGGIIVSSVGTDGTVVQRNLIGTTADGANALANSGPGIWIQGSNVNTRIGGSLGANTIAHNAGDGINIASTGNCCPLQVDISRNAIFANVGLGIDVDPDTVTPNDPDDSDLGPNGTQNFPMLDAATSSGAATEVSGTLNSEANKTYRLEFFSSPACDSSGFGEGETYLGTSNVTTDGGGDVSFDVTLATVTSAGQVVTATATDPSGNTSEFSACETVVTVVDGPSMTVNTAADSDDGACTVLNCSLREALDDADSTPGLDTISFSIAGAGVHTIAPTSALPAIDQPVVIDATTQPGYSGTPLIELNGTGAGAGVTGLRILGGGTTVRGFAINRFGGAGLLITSVGGNTIQGNLIGTDPSGTVDLGNGGRGIDIRTSNNVVGGTSSGQRNLISGNSGEGMTFQAGSGSVVQGNLIGTDVTGSVAISNGTSNLTLFSTATGTLIGGTAAGAGNLISGGPLGISLSGSGNTVQGNLIGTNAAGTADLGNTADGISVGGANNLIGGSAAGARNVVSGNNQTGIIIDGAGATGNIVQGNYIGTNAAGTAAIGNNLGGIMLRASNNQIGGTGAGEGNVISGNANEGGIRFVTGAVTPSNNTVQGNLIGTNAAGTAAVPNRFGVQTEGGTGNVVGGSVAGAGNLIAFNTFSGVVIVAGTGTRVSGNSIHSNGALGINLGAFFSGVQPNDAGDADAGPNNLQNFPVLTSAILDQSTTTVAGTLDTANGVYRVELFSAPSCDPSGNGEGRTFLGSTDVTVSGGGLASFSVDLPVATTVGDIATATATDASGNTSEFSMCQMIEEQAGFTLDLTKAGIGEGTVSSNPAGIDCGPTCSAEFNDGTAVTLSALPDLGSTFEGWNGEGCSGTGTCVVTLDQARSVTATFEDLPPLFQSLNDDFDGSALDAGNWNTSVATSDVRWCASTDVNHLSASGQWQDVSAQACHGLFASPPHGTITVSGGEANFAAGTRRTFPYVWRGRPSRGSPFPSTGAFVLEVRMRFPSLAPNGTEFHVREWPNTDPVGNNPPGDTPPGGDVFAIGACGACGLVVNLLGVPAAVPGSSTAYHDYRLEYVNDRYSVWVDGVRAMGPVASPVRPDAIWIGNPVFTHWTNSDWTDLTMDSMRVLVEHLTLSVSKDGTGDGTVTSIPAGIDCGPTCSAEFDANQVVTLSATPNANSSFMGWSGAGCSGTGDCVVTMDQARSVTATFTKNTFMLDVTKAGNGGGTVTSTPAGIDCGPTCTASFDDGTQVTLSATPNANSSFMGWSGAGCSGTGDCVVTMDQARSVTATFTKNTFMLDVTKAGNGGGTVTSTPAGIDCGPTCTASFDDGTQVTLSATPNANSSFMGWSGAGCSGTGDCVVTMDQARSVTATFEMTAVTHQLSVTRTGAGGGTVSSDPAGIDCGPTCSAAFIDGTVVTLTAIPDANSDFNGWSGGGCFGYSTCVVTMDQARSVTAGFVPIMREVIVVKLGSAAGAGTIVSSPPAIDCGPTCGTVVAQGTTLTLTATAGPDSTFTGWSGAGCSGTGTCTFSANQDTSVTATFVLDKHTLTIIKGGAGGGTVTSAPAGIDCGSTCSFDFDHGAVVTLTATPNASSSFTGWSGAGCSGAGACQVTIDQARSVNATFAVASRTLTVTKDGGGTGTVTSNPAGINCGATCSAGYAHGTVVTLTATPGANSALTGWSGSGCSGTGTCVVTMDQARSVTATFASTIADLSVTQTASPDPIRAGYDVAYTVQVSNQGPASAAGVVLTDVLSGGGVVFGSATTGQGSCTVAGSTITCNLGTIANGATVSVTIIASATTVGTTSGAASVTSSSPDTVSNNNQASKSVQVQGASCTIVGTQANNTLNGTNGPDVICGLGGNDTVNGANGADTLFGGAGNDGLSGGSGDDNLYGQTGTDTISGAAGVDYVRYDGASGGVSVNLGNGTATGADGADSLSTVESVVGSAFNDSLVGSPATNVVEGIGGNDTLDGAGGTDYVSYALSAAGVSVNLLTGTATGGAGSDSLAGFENIYGSGSADGLTGNDATNWLYGLGGNDALNGAGGSDSARYDFSPSAVTINLPANSSSGGDGNDSFISIELFVGSPFGDSFIGDAGNNSFAGIGGSDNLNGAGGSDAIFYDSAPSAVFVNLNAGTSSGGDGVDTIVGVEVVVGSAFNDSLIGSAAPDTLQGMAGDDNISAAGGNDQLYGGLGNDTLIGGGGSDIVRYETAPSAVTVNLNNGTSSGGDGSDTISGAEAVVGSAFNDSLVGSSASDELNGGAGDDSISSAGGDDHLIGAAGNDVLIGGGGANDVVHYDAAPSAVTVNLNSGTSSGGDGSDSISGVEAVVGSAFNDSLVGSSGVDAMYGMGGNDTISAAGGNDYLFGGLGNDTLTGGGGFDYVYYNSAASAVTVNLNAGTSSGGDGSDVITATTVEGVVGSNFADQIVGNQNANALYGGSGNDTISGASGDDALFGEDGNDSLTGGPGNDTLDGGPGSDSCTQNAGSGTISNCP